MMAVAKQPLLIYAGSFFSIAFGSVPTAMAYLVPFDVVLMVTQGVFVQLRLVSLDNVIYLDSDILL